jgi:hypothetical protein
MHWTGPALRFWPKPATHQRATRARRGASGERVGCGASLLRVRSGLTLRAERIALGRAPERAGRASSDQREAGLSPSLVRGVGHARTRPSIIRTRARLKGGLSPASAGGVAAATDMGGRGTPTAAWVRTLREGGSRGEPAVPPVKRGGSGEAAYDDARSPGRGSSSPVSSEPTGVGGLRRKSSSYRRAATTAPAAGPT